MPAPATALLMSAQAAAPAFSPFALGWHSAVWADDPAWSNPGNNVVVTSWRNGGSSGLTLTQATGSRQPTFRSSEALLNGKGCVDFDGDDYIGTAGFGPFTEPCSMVWIGKLDTSTGSGNPRFVEVNNGPPYTSLLFQDGGSKLMGMYNNAFYLASPDVPASTLVPYAMRGLAKASDHKISINGAVTTTASGSDPTALLFGLGSNNGGSASRSNNRTGFAGYYRGDVTADGQWSAFVSWVSTYYGLTIA